MFTYGQLSTAGMLDAGNEKLDISLIHDGTILSGDRSAGGALVSCHDDKFAMVWKVCEKSGGHGDQQPLLRKRYENLE
jgi:hypothetical protein